MTNLLFLSRAVCLAALLAHTVSALPPTPILSTAPKVIPATPTNDSTSDVFKYAVVGDSWSAGVSWDPSNEYDANADNCWRYADSWPARLEHDASWTVAPNRRLAFAACAGARFHTTAHQLENIGTPGLVLATVGGNDADFVGIMKACVYRPLETSVEGKYGRPYWDDEEGSGLCKRQLAWAREYIDEGGLERDLMWMLDALVDSPAARGGGRFDFYLLSYASFFNAETDECDNWSFQVDFGKGKDDESADPPALLTKALRREMNDAAHKYNAVYENAVRNYNAPPGMNLGFINIDTLFEGHRFCEKGQSLKDQFGGRNVWFFNLDHKDLSPISRKNDRPFHPKSRAHRAIKKHVIERLREDGVPGVRL